MLFRSFGTGSQIGSTGWYCVFDGTGTPSVTVTGLSTSLSYRVMAVEYNGSGATANYLTTTATGNLANFTTDNPTVLAAGDIALIELQSDTPDNFSFVTLADIKDGTTIYFTDNAWTGTALAATEGTLTWTATSFIPRGTVVSYDGSSVSSGTTISESNFALSFSGDNIFVYQGSSSTPTFIYGLSSLSWISTGSSSSNTSYLPSGLTNGTTARDFATEVDNNYFNGGTLTGNKATILASIVTGKQIGRAHV